MITSKSKMDYQQLQTFWNMFKRSLKIGIPTISTRTINQMVWNSLNIIVFSYIMPHLGLKASYNTFIILTMPASSIFFVCMHQIYNLLFDVTEGNGNIRYELTLPISSNAIFIKYALEYACISFISCAPLFFFGWLLIKCSIPLTLLGILKLYFILTLTALFSGFFALYITSITKDLALDLDNMWVRIIFPLWFIGCFQFSWKDLFSISPAMGYLNLLNPLTFALEGSRASIALQSSSLNYWYCVLGLISFTLFFSYLSIKQLKQRLDSV